GGPLSYGGRRYELPEIGPRSKGREPEDILRAMRLTYITTFLFLAAALPLCLLAS
ncbi:MAG: cobalamin biosynthesis protein CobD, partial [Deltaproteobacteria bacterium]